MHAYQHVKYPIGFVGPHSRYVGKFSKRVLGEPRDVGVGTLLVDDYVTSSSSCTALCKGEAERWGTVHTKMNC